MILVSGATSTYRFPLIYKLWDTFYQCTGILVSVVSVLLRIMMNLATMLAALARVDRTPCPQWFQQIIDLDTPSKAYWGMIMEAHTHNNPVMICFLNNLWDSIKARKHRQDATEDRDATTHGDSMYLDDEENAVPMVDLDSERARRESARQEARRERARRKFASPESARRQLAWRESARWEPYDFNYL